MDWTRPPYAIKLGETTSSTARGRSETEQVHMIGIDLAKQGFQLHGARPDGSVAFRKKLTRRKVLGFLASQPPCEVAIEACGSALYWGREIGVKLEPIIGKVTLSRPG